MSDLFDQIHAEAEGTTNDSGAGGAGGAGGDIFDQIHAMQNYGIPEDARTGPVGNQTTRFRIPPGAEFMGAPVLPVGQFLPTVAGWGTMKAGEHFGLPDWANTTAGLLAGGMVSGGSEIFRKIMSLSPELRAEAVKRAIKILPHGSDINAFRDLFKRSEPAPFEPFKPNPGVVRTLRYGGPAEPEYGSTGYKGVGMSGAPEPPPAPEPAAPPEPWQPNKVNPAIARKIRYGGSENQYGGSGYGNPGSRGRGRGGGGGVAPANPNIVGAPPSSISTSIPGEGPSVAPGQTPVRQHETNVKVDQQITNKVNNLADYLRSKGGTPEHLDQIVQDPALTRQYLNEAHSYGVSRGTPVPKTGYKGLDPGSDSYKAVRQRIIDMIEEEKNKP